MARNFYKKDGSYYYADNNQKILNMAELREASKSGVEVTPPNTGGRDFYQLNGSYYYADNNQKILNEAELATAARSGREIKPDESTAYVDKLYADAAAKNPVIADLAKGGSSIEEIIHGLSTGDISGLVDWQGQPFSAEDQQAALAKGMEDNKLFYEAQQQKAKADAESSLAQQQANYQDYLIQSGQQFEADKTASDQQSADRGVLFSGSRVQREKNLERAYQQDQASKLRNVGTNMANTARNFQYNYGNDQANSLKNYYNLGSNTFNANKATGGVGSGGLSSVYDPNKFKFQGTENTARMANANTRAAGYLWNKGNKLLASGYKNQY